MITEESIRYEKVGPEKGHKENREWKTREQRRNVGKNLVLLPISNLPVLGERKLGGASTD